MADLDRIASKIEKLLALAEGKGNEAESAAAWAKAQALATEYQLDLECLRQKGEGPAPDMTQSISKRPDASWKMSLVCTLASLNACKVMTSRSSLYVLGEKNDVQVVLGLFERIVKQVRHLSRAEAARQGEKHHSRWETSYRIGMVMRVNERLESAFRKTTDSCTALVLSRDSRTEEYVNSLYPSRKSRSINMSASDASVLVGYAHGDRVQLHTEIE